MIKTTFQPGDRVTVAHPYPHHEDLKGRTGTLRAVFENRFGDEVDVDAYLDPLEGDPPAEDPTVFAICELTTVEEGPLQ